MADILHEIDSIKGSTKFSDRKSACIVMDPQKPGDATQVGPHHTHANPAAAQFIQPGMESLMFENAQLQQHLIGYMQENATLKESIDRLHETVHKLVTGRISIDQVS